jgi:hypothetical protein
MANTEQRVAALEAAAAAVDHSVLVVIAESGETADQAQQRAGVEPGQQRVIVVTFD